MSRMKITVKDNQTIYDIALQYAGSLEAVIDILEANSKLNTELKIGEELVIPSVLAVKVANFFNDKGVVIATSATPMEVDEWVAPEGLDRKVEISVNGELLDVVQAPKSVGFNVVDSNDDPVTVDIVDGKVKVPSLPVCEEWIRPCWWATVPTIGENEIWVLFKHDTDETIEFPVSKDTTFESDIYINGILEGSLNHGVNWITIDPATQGFIENGCKWSWLNFKVLSHITYGSVGSIDFSTVDATKIKGSNQSLMIKEVICNITPSTLSISHTVSVAFGPSGANRYGAEFLEHIHNLTEFSSGASAPRGYRYLSGLRHITNIGNFMPDIRNNGINLTGEFNFNSKNIRDYINQSTGELRLKINTTPALSQCYNFPGAVKGLIELELTNCINVIHSSPVFNNCINIKRIIVKDLKQSFSMINCYSMTLDAMKDTVASLYDMTGSTSQSINMTGTTLDAAEMVELGIHANAKNWILIN